MSGEKILVVDDRRENLLFLANSVLRPEGYKVITGMDGKEGLDKALAEQPDLIIMDLKMPRMSGLEVLSALRKANCDIPVILTTFYGSEQAAIQAFRQGVKDYIIKPYEVKEMLDSVERALSEQRLRRETMGLKEGAEVSHHLEERVRQLHSLCGINKALGALQDPEEVMRVTVEAAIYLTGAESGQIFLLDPRNETARMPGCARPIGPTGQVSAAGGRRSGRHRGRPYWPGHHDRAQPRGRPGFPAGRTAAHGRQDRRRAGDGCQAGSPFHRQRPLPARHPGRFRRHSTEQQPDHREAESPALGPEPSEGLGPDARGRAKPGGEPAESGSVQPSAVDLAESIADAQQLAQNLRDLAVAAQALGFQAAGSE